jgi:hypothetical protein
MYIIDHKINKSLYRLRDHITSELLDWMYGYGNEITQHKRGLAKKAVSCFLLNAYKPYTNSLERVGLTLDRTSYSNKVVVNGKNSNRKVSYKFTRILLTFLEQREYISLYVGGKVNYEFIKNKWVFIDREKSYATLLVKLINLFNELVTNYKPTPLSNVIILRDKDKKSLTFKLDDTTKDIRGYIYGYNSFSLGYTVSCRETLYDVQIFKIFNVVLGKGGRSFMKDGIQNLSSEERKLIEIDGESVCIFDYKGFEPSLCYTMCQEVFEGDDYYSVDGMEEYDPVLLRSICKLSLLIMFNTQSRRSAQSAINEVLAKEFDVPNLYKKGKIPYKHIPVKVILELLESKHHLISHKFYCGFGNELQYAGSLIIDYVTDYMMQSHKCLVLTVFDECIAKEEFRELLYSTMVEAYDHVLGFSDNCKITVEQ